jgi:(E)-4-hydroxy-3-methyl-but-2-enyl pyrophosphate reductase
MQIKLAKEYGFCFGVKRALEMVETVLKQNNEGCPVYSIGPIIHNPQVVEKLKNKGVKIVAGVEDMQDNGIFVIRSHGITPKQLENAKRKGLTIIDATCPFVKHAQDICSLLKNEGYNIIIIGEKEHPEVRALIGFAGEDSSVVKDIADLEKINRKKKTGILSQTTQQRSNVVSIIENIEWYNKFQEMRIFDTICEATSRRQAAALKLSKEVDIMLVIGGYNSSNTKKLAELAENTGVETHHIESNKDLKKEWFLEKNIIGVTAGASTPDWIITEIINNIKAFKA